MTTICVIPARGGSRRIPKKNIKLFYGKPIIAYSIEAAKASKLFDRIVVSTDDQGIAYVARAYGVEVHERSVELSKDEVGTFEVTRALFHAYRSFQYKLRVERVCTIYATSPMISVEDIVAGYNILVRRIDRVDHVISVGSWLEDAGQFYWSSERALLNGDPYLGPYTVMLPIDPHRVCDINTFEDWERAERMYAEFYQLDLSSQMLNVRGNL